MITKKDHEYFDESNTDCFSNGYSPHSLNNMRFAKSYLCRIFYSILGVHKKQHNQETQITIIDTNCLINNKIK